jgi:hypothetical protein
MRSAAAGGGRGVMARLEPASRRRLAAIGIDVWSLRSGPPASLPEPSAATLPGTESARIRLSSGSGDWLFVQKAPWRGAHESLLADMTATIGPERVRFGQWAIGSGAGETLEELASRGIRRVLSLGPMPGEAGDERVIVAPTLDELASEGSARKALWQALAPYLGR